MKIPLLFLVASPFALLRGISSQNPIPRQLCALQVSLVNYVCGYLPLLPLKALPPPSSQMEPQPQPPPPFPVRRRRHRHRETPQEQCCRWLKIIDVECACAVLVFLPNFLARPNHIYTVIVGQTCRITYTCGGRLRP